MPWVFNALYKLLSYYCLKHELFRKISVIRETGLDTTVDTTALTQYCNSKLERRLKSNTIYTLKGLTKHLPLYERVT